MTWGKTPFECRNPYNNINPEEWEEPFTDIIRDKKGREIIIITDLRGVTKEDIEINATDISIHIKAARGEIKYNLNRSLGAVIYPKSVRAEFNNGILEITAQVKKKERSKINAP